MNGTPQTQNRLGAGTIRVWSSDLSRLEVVPVNAHFEPDVPGSTPALLSTYPDPLSGEIMIFRGAASIGRAVGESPEAIALFRRLLAAGVSPDHAAQQCPGVTYINNLLAPPA